MRALKIAVLLGLLGPLPGYLHYIITHAGGGMLVSSPADLGGFWLPFMFWYMTGVVPLFGSYCFVVGVIGAVLHDQLSTRGALRGVRIGAVVMLGMGASVPAILLGGSITSDLGLEGVISAAFWILAYLLLTIRGGCNACS